MSECYDKRKTRLALKMEEGHGPRNAVGLQQLEMTKRQILPYNLQKQSCLYLDFIVSPISDFELQISEINCCSKLLNFVLICYIKETIKVTISNFPLKLNLAIFSIKSNFVQWGFGSGDRKETRIEWSSSILYHFSYSPATFTLSAACLKSYINTKVL